MKIGSGIARLAIASACAVLASSASGQSAARVRTDAAQAAQKAKEAEHARAVERCKANRGIDCDTPQGLEEWLQQERTRAEAVAAGSRHRLPGSATSASRR